MAAAKKALAVLRNPSEWWSTTFQSPSSKFHGSKISVSGSTAHGFEEVKAAFTKNFETGQERAAQFVAVWRGRKVVDLWGCQEHGFPNYGASTVQVCMSCTKVLTSICIAMAVDRGFFSYEDRISRYWPEFSKHGKGELTIAQMMRHDGGLSTFFRAFTLRDAMDQDCMSRLIEDSHLYYDFHVDTDRSYHAITRGMVLNQLFRRTVGTTLGHFVRTEIAPKLHDSSNSLFLGVTSDEYAYLSKEGRIAPIGVISPLKLLARAAVGYLSNNQAVSNMTVDAKRRVRVVLTNRNTVMTKTMRAMKVPPAPDTFHSEDFLAAELPSVNGLANARAYGELAGMMAMGGGPLLRAESLRISEGGGTCKIDAVMNLKCTFSRGGFSLFNATPEDKHSWPAEMTGFVGWGGIGGSLFAWHPQLQLGVCYTCSGLHSPATSILGAKDPRCIANIRALLGRISVLEAPAAAGSTETRVAAGNTKRSRL